MVSEIWSKILLFGGLWVIVICRMNVKQCEEYKGKICDQLDYDENNQTMLVYVHQQYSQDEIEIHLKKMLNKLEEHPYVSCVTLIKQVLCHRLFPVCRQKQGKAYSVQQTCREDCEKAKNSVCYSAVKDIPELSERLLGVSCMTLPFARCLHLDIPSTQTTAEYSCQLGNYKVGSTLEKVNILRNFLPLSSEKASYKENSVASASNCQHTRCVQTETVLSHLLKDLKINKIRQLRNLIVENQKHRFINGYCYRNCSTKSGYIQVFKTRIGNLKQYMIDKYLTLSNMDVYIEKNTDGVSVTGKGVYNLCGTLFRYNLWPEKDGITIMHSMSNQAIHMLVIELSHRLKPFPREIEATLTYKLKVIQTLNLTNPTWSIVWHQGKRLSAFKGVSTLLFEEESISNAKTELMIGADLRFWLVKVTLKLNLDQILRSILPVAIEFVPFINKRWFTELPIDQVEYIFSTDGVDVPTTEYLKQHYSLYKDFQDGKIHRGMHIKFQGRTRRPKKNAIELPLLEDETLFQIAIDVGRNGNTTFEAQFEEDSTVSCVSKMTNLRHWDNFIRRIKTMQRKSNHAENAIIKTQAECGHCCDSKAYILLSIKGNTYQEHRFLLTREINYFVDCEIRISVKNTIYKYVIKKYKVYTL